MLIDLYFFYATRNSYTISNDLVENKQVFSVALTTSRPCVTVCLQVGKVLKANVQFEPGSEFDAHVSPKYG